MAAGGRGERAMRVSAERVALASIYFRKPNGRRVYAYLRWSVDGRTRERCVGEATRATRAANLAEGWRLAHERGLLAGSSPPDPAAPAAAPESWASSRAVRAVMRANKSKDTAPERALRSAIHSLGLRYRVGVRPIPGFRRTADLVFTRARVAVFLDGCFWHGCPEHYRPATRNSEFWTAKIAGNQARDANTDAALADAGWRIVRVWEHEEPTVAAQRVAQLVRGESGAGPGPP
jgi:DNA mismatch endonuclease (patch repair protein)